jgi:hypothetical protein
MEEKTKLVIVLAQESRHAVALVGENRDISCGD